MLPRLALVLGLSTLVAGGCTPGPMTPCTPTTPGASCPSSEAHNNEIAGAVVGSVLLVALVAITVQVVPLVMYMKARGHAG